MARAQRCRAAMLPRLLRYLMASGYRTFQTIAAFAARWRVICFARRRSASPIRCLVRHTSTPFTVGMSCLLTVATFYCRLSSIAYFCPRRPSNLPVGGGAPADSAAFTCSLAFDGTRRWRRSFRHITKKPWQDQYLP